LDNVPFDHDNFLSFRSDTNCLAVDHVRGSFTVLIFKFRVPVGPTALGRGIQNGPERVKIWRASRILARVGHFSAHLAAPEMADRGTL
jgi:hypothetical protein